MHRHFRAFFVTAASTLLPAFAAAQSFNVDVYNVFGTPSSALGAGAGQPGVWNDVSPFPGTTPLVDLAGGATAVTITATGAGLDVAFDNPGTSGDDQALMDDISDTSPSGTWTFSGLTPGPYLLYTYAWAPDDPGYISRVTVAGSTDPAQTVNGAWPDGYALGVTHAKHFVLVGGGGTLAATISVAPGGVFASLNGFQLTKLPDSFVQNCLPGQGGVIGCPCSNPPAAPGLGCDNFGTGPADSGTLSGTGAPSLSADTVLLSASGENNTSFNVFFTGEGALSSGTAHAAGVRCVDVNLKRLYNGNAVGGAITRPGGGDPTVSARTAALGAPISPGQTRHYFNIYRDPLAAGPCGNTSSTVNLTSAGSFTWIP